MLLTVFSDFDGTITRRDCMDALADAYIGREARRRYDALFMKGECHLWQALDTSLQACGVPLEEAIGFLLGTVELDPSFGRFHAWCRRAGVPLEIVSAGLFEVIQSFLAHAELSAPILANRAAPRAGCFGLAPLAADCPTGVDKAARVREARALGRTVAFVGDGFSDRWAAPEADLVYAKSGLARYCEAKGLAYVPFESFSDVQADLLRRFPHLQGHADAPGLA
jgi:2-hydroxy-3-keto-5-methylthiopentenyl-1-phosphate phosphatase